MRIAVSGLMGQFACGGIAWDYLQYLLGFRALGHEVWYLEDSGVWPYDPATRCTRQDCSYNVAYLDAIMREFGFADRWIYRNGADLRFHGAGETAARDLVKHADLLVNISSTAWLEDYDIGIKHHMFIDGDPMFSQVGLLDIRNAAYAARVRAHDSHFTLGLCVGEPGCLVPDIGIAWKKTVQPIALEHWPFQKAKPIDRFTTVMNWAPYKPLEWMGRHYRQKDVEFQRFATLPSETPQRLEVAIGQSGGIECPVESLRKCGWSVFEADDLLPDHARYHEFLRTSKAEWSVAKHGYVAARTGWFSGRTACYLALGRPAVVQDTGWSDHLPSGQGVIAFSTPDEAIAAIAEINAHYLEHQMAARALAVQYFDAKKVCANLLTQAGL